MIKYLVPLLLFLCNVIFAEKTIIIMLDGFRWDYTIRLTEHELPNFKHFEATGVRAEYVEPIFPSLSWPSWTTISTGLYPEQHGIVGNYMYDAETQEIFEHETRGNHSWWKDHIPLWTTTTKAGLKTSLYLWSRCDVPFDNILPDKCYENNYNKYDARNLTLFKNNLLSAADDINNRGYEVSFVYYGNIDHYGHKYGPDKFEVMEETIKVDKVLGEFFDALDTVTTNVIITTDHGMTYMDDKYYKPLLDALDPAEINKMVEYGGYANLDLAEGIDANQVVEKIRKEFPGMEAYTKENMPTYLQYKNHKYIHDVIILSKGTELVSQDANNGDSYVPEATPTSNGVKDKNLGNHGWNDNTPNGNYDSKGNMNDMRGIFMARGPSFRSDGAVVPWIKLVDEYQIFLRAIEIEGLPNKGSKERIESFFSSAAASTSYSNIFLLTLVSSAFSIQ